MVTNRAILNYFTKEVRAVLLSGQYVNHRITPRSVWSYSDLFRWEWWFPKARMRKAPQKSEESCVRYSNLQLANYEIKKWRQLRNFAVFLQNSFGSCFPCHSISNPNCAAWSFVCFLKSIPLCSVVNVPGLWP